MAYSLRGLDNLLLARSRDLERALLPREEEDSLPSLPERLVASLSLSFIPWTRWPVFTFPPAREVPPPDRGVRPRDRERCGLSYSARGAAIVVVVCMMCVVVFFV